MTGKQIDSEGDGREGTGTLGEREGGVLATTVENGARVLKLEICIVKKGVCGVDTQWRITQKTLELLLSCVSF